MFAAVFGLIGVFSIRKGLWVEFYAAIALCIAFTFLALFFPFLLRPLNSLWFKFGNVLHKLLSPLVMLALFVVAIVPMGVLMKLSRRDPLKRFFDEMKHSYWEERPVEEVTVDSMKQQF
jgi:hypothetical protein